METEKEFNNPTPVVVCLVPMQDQEGFIGQRRAIAPKIGELAFPSGFIDEGESAEVAASRECSEEIGKDIPVDSWTTLGTRITPDNKILIFVTTEETFESKRIAQFTPNLEVSELAVLTKDSKLAFPLHQEILKMACAQSRSKSNLWLAHWIGLMFITGAVIQLFMGYRDVMQDYGISQGLFKVFTIVEFLLGYLMLVGSSLKSGKSGASN